MSDEKQATLLHLEERELTPDELWKAAKDASDAVEKEEMAILEESAWVRDQRFRIERMETNHTMNVFAAKADPRDPDSKALFTNDTSRKAEVSRRMSEDPAYKEAMAALLVAEKNQAIRKIHLDRLLRDYQLQKLMFQFFAIGRREGD